MGIEEAQAIEDLGGELTAPQRLKVDTIVATRRAWAASLAGGLRDEDGDSGVSRSTRPSPASRKRRRALRKLKKKSRRKNR